MLLLLHGVGSNERDLFGFAERLDPRFYVLSLQAPYALGPNQFGWYEIQFKPSGPDINPAQLESSRQKMAAFIGAATEHYGADPGRVYLFGFSQGATVSLTLLLTAPNLVAGVVAVAGRIPRELFQANTPLSGKLAEMDELKGLPLFLGYGQHDDVVPIRYGHQAEELFGQAPLEMTYREYEMAHEINAKCLREIDLWLRTQMGSG